jgi:HEAT repeat protein
LLAVIAAADAGLAGGQESRAKEKAMNAPDFARLFENRDWSAVQIAREFGPQVIASIQPYLRSAKYQDRLLAVDCVAAAGGPVAARLLIGMLGDANEQVRINAVNALHTNLPAGLEGELISAWDASHTRDGYVRQQIPMILGRMQSRQEIGPLKSRLNADPRQEVRDGMVAGLSKLGEPDARSAFGQMLRDARGRRTADIMELVKYLDEPWVLPLLAPVLERRDVALALSTHLRSVTRRECDLAVDEVIRISRAPFSFELHEASQYSEGQVQEALRYVRARKE